MRILFAASECIPFAKTGGLGDVVGSLAKNLKLNNQDIRVILPFYKNISENFRDVNIIAENLKVHLGKNEEIFSIKQAYIINDLPIYFIDNNKYFERDFIYGTDKAAYLDNAERFIFFSKAVIEALKVINFQPDIIHTHDWPTALIPGILKTAYKSDNFFYKTKTVFTIHNMMHQGIFDPKVLELAGISWEEFSIEKFEYYGNVNFLKAGIVYSDAITTVSKTYSKEIQENPEFGMGLSGVLKTRKDMLFGINNGVDYDDWNPEKDKYILKNFSSKDLSGKLICKKNLQELCGFKIDNSIPLISIIARIDSQKGFDLISEGLHHLMKENAQFVILGTGDRKYSDFFAKVGEQYKTKFKFFNIFDTVLAHKIYAGSDMFLMPSYFEPCGLTQLISMKYGTVPIVTHVGGLIDTVKPYDKKKETGTGFFIKEYSVYELLEAINRASSVYKKTGKWKNIIQHIMKLNFSWEYSIKEYIKLYEDISSRK
jgi:starch synthase